MLSLSGVREQKGFELGKSFESQADLIVLTGKNGAGKTRVLEAIVNGAISALSNGCALSQPSIMLLPLSSLMPSFGHAMGDAYLQSRITQTVAYFERSRELFNLPHNPGHEAYMAGVRNHGAAPAMSYSELHKLCRRIAERLEIPVEEVKSQDINTFFEEPLTNVFGVYDLSNACNSYIRKKHQNLYNFWRKSELKDDVSCVPPEKFVEYFGLGPWVNLNKVVESVFNEKFTFSVPDESSHSYGYVAELLNSKTGETVALGDLSSGEQTLLWLALTLYNTQYCASGSEAVPKLLLLDEPDAFLHPKMVVKFYEVVNKFISTFKTYVLITTHSPTTVALAPEKSVCIVADSLITPVDKDAAIAELLDGITQVSIDPANRREVFVENIADARVYKIIFDYLRNDSRLIDPKVSLSFVPSGPKVSIDTLSFCLKEIFEIVDEKKINQFYESVNGGGDYGQVTGYVESLQGKGSRTVRGIVDWDMGNKPKKGIIVHAYEYAYTLENVLLDPVCIMYLLHMENPDKYKVISYCNEEVRLEDWLGDDKLLQVSVDRFVEGLLGFDDAARSDLTYVSGKVLTIDARYLLSDGHQLKGVIVRRYEELKRFDRRDGGLLVELAKTMTMKIGKGFVPKSIERALFELQQSL